MLKERSQTFKLSFISLDFLNALISFGFAFIIRYFLLHDGPFQYSILDVKSYISLGILLSISQIISFLGVDLYHPRRGLSFVEEFFSILSGIVLNLIVVLALLFFFREISFSRLVIIFFAIINIITTIIIHYLFRIFLMRMREKGYNLRKMLILGTGISAKRITEVVIRHAIYGYSIIGYLKEKDIEPNLKFPILGSITNLENILMSERPDLVIYALGEDEINYLHKAIDSCDSEGIELKIVPAFSEFVTARGRIEGMDGIPIITIRDIPLRNGYNKVVKRVFDILFSFLFILLFSPIYLLIALLVKLSSKGPIFIYQERVGLDNKKFQMIKFRSMLVQEKSESDTKWTIKNDPRITPIGSILRKLSLDETPQFFNALIGDMSVVGPRPERPFYVEQFKTSHKHYMRRHAVKAGITGWAQVQGLRGDTSIEDRIEADIYYIENWSLIMDLKIILMTPFTGFINKNAY
jgi:Undecaprenyl-phosphate glucose phosphotransferase